MKLHPKFVLVAVVIAAVFFSGGFFASNLCMESSSQKTRINTFNNQSENCSHPETEYIVKNETSFSNLFDEVKSSIVSLEVERSSDLISGEAQGSGWFYDSKGHIVTNYHVVKDSKDISVRFLDGTVLDAEVVGGDQYSDLAVLKIDSSKDLEPLKLGDSSKIDVGDPVAALGNPFGLSGSMTTGIVSQKGRMLSSLNNFFIANVIQTDAAMNPGNSGGPLLNLKGEVIGVNTAIKSNTGTFTGIGFAIPSNTVKRVVKSIIKNGEYEHPWVGITGTEVTPEIAKAMDLEKTTGFLVLNIEKDSPAYKSDLRGGDTEVKIDGKKVRIGGDVIVGIDGRKVRKYNDLLNYLETNKEAGDKVTLEVIRDGELKEIELTLGERPQP